MTAKGTFAVKLTPAAGAVTRMTIDKVFYGDLTGASKGEMLAAMTPVKGSAGYVAIETVTGELAGRKGAFTLQHSGTMSGGNQELSVTVVPDSATGDLTGLAGRMSIRIEGKEHFYEFTYSLPSR